MPKYIYEIDTDHVVKAQPSTDLYEARTNVLGSALQMSEFQSDVTIMVIAFNRLEKTKQCIESILKNTQDVNYDLLLIDSGSSDGTFEYYKSVDYDKVRILRLSKNVSAGFPSNFVNFNWIAKYYVTVTNDLIVTPNWLSNLIKVAESDPTIGMVNAMSSNASNCQGYDMQFSDLDEMQLKAAEFNKSNPAKWHERLRMITLGTLYKKECLYTLGWPISDIGFFHDFSDDDVAFRVRRSGYKIMLAKDTWIHHNHKVFELENKTPEGFKNSIECGRKNFQDKYLGIDAWDDVNNFIPEYVAALKNTFSEQPAVLGIDVRCGTPILEIKNNIRSFGKFNATCHAFTQDGKYFTDLLTVCGTGNVACGDIRNLATQYPHNSFDYIVIGNNINTYADPYQLISSAYNLLKPGGQLFLSLKNTNDALSFLHQIGNFKINCPETALNYSVTDFANRLAYFNYNAEFLGAIPYDNSVLSDNIKKYLSDCINKLATSNQEEICFRLMADRFAFVITKPSDN